VHPCAPVGRAVARADRVSRYDGRGRVAAAGERRLWRRSAARCAPRPPSRTCTTCLCPDHGDSSRTQPREDTGRASSPRGRSSVGLLHCQAHCYDYSTVARDLKAKQPHLRRHRIRYSCDGIIPHLASERRRTRGQWRSQDRPAARSYPQTQAASGARKEVWKPRVSRPVSSDAPRSRSISVHTQSAVTRRSHRYDTDTWRACAGRAIATRPRGRALIGRAESRCRSGAIQPAPRAQ
jgi:hypothetical protein